MNTIKSIGEVVVAVLVCLFMCYLGMVIFTAFGVGGLSVLCVLIIAAGLLAKN